ncbi:MAG: enoyl-CoA hydratase/isomerase family protein [Hydrogenibacillus schlegelii]|nr:enoyl-CoA hydratase/isomerase family protein [Hydrogenibacillus schlegelii]
MKAVLWDVDADGGIGWITLHRPEVRNALNAEMLDALQSALKEAQAREDIRTVVLRGEGSAFCAGGDLKEIQTLGPFGVRRLLNEKIRPLLRSLMLLDKPVIAALNGPVAGAGIGLALACDVVLAAKEATLITAFGKVGAMPDAAMIYFLVQHIGLKRAMELILRGEPLSAEAALALGLYTRVVEREALEALTLEWARDLARGPTLAYAMAKRAARDAVRLPFDAFMDLESASQALLHVSADHQEGIVAFLAKRPPQFQGK